MSNYYNTETLLEQQAEIEKLKAERDALAATVEVLRDAGNEVYAELQQWALSESHEETNRVFKLWLAVRAATPQHHLREVRAEAVLDFIEFMYKSKDCQLCSKSLDKAKQYFNQVRRGEV